MATDQVRIGRGAARFIDVRSAPGSGASRVRIRFAASRVGGRSRAGFGKNTLDGRPMQHRRRLFACSFLVFQPHARFDD